LFHHIRWWIKMILWLWGSYQESVGILWIHFALLDELNLLLLMRPLKVFSVDLRCKVLLLWMLRLFKILWVWGGESMLVMGWLLRGNDMASSPLRLSSSVLWCFSFP
jgi:hypothetical protein